MFSKKALFLSFLSSLIYTIGICQTKQIELSKTNMDGNISFNKYVLDNGLTLIMHQTEAFGDAVHVEVKYHVGSSREQKGKSGFAHLFEHLMFQGSKHVLNDEHFKIIQENGGSMNGTTNKDRTNYYETVPSHLLETALWLESDRMGFLLDSITQEKLDNQRDVVKNERLQRYDNKPYGLMRMNFNKAFYPEGHPYNWPTIGYMDELNSANLEDVQKFFLRWYGANNATLALVGNFDEAKALKWIEKYFGNLKRCPTVYSDKQIPIEFTEDQILITEENVPLPVLKVAFPTVDFNHDDYLPLQALAYIMSGNKSAFLTKNILDKNFAQQAYAYQSSKELSGEFHFYFKAPEQQSLMVIESLWKASLYEFEKKGATLTQLEAFKAQKENEIKNRGSSLSSISKTLTFGEIFKDNPNYSQEELQKLRKLSYASLERVYNTYIKNKPGLYQAVYPKGKKEDWDGITRFKPLKPLKKFINKAEYDTLVFRPNISQFDRSLRPKIEPASYSEMFDFKSEKWKNGIRVITSTNYMSKINRVDFHLPAGRKYESEGLFGATQLLTKLFKEGSVNFTAQEFFTTLEAMGSSLKITSNYDEITFSLQAQDKHMHASIAMVYDLINQPAFNQNDFLRIQKQSIQTLKSKVQNPTYLVDKYFQESIYGNQSALSYPLGKIEDIERLRLNDLKRFYRERIGSKNTRIVYSGRLPFKAYKKDFDIFKKWTKFNADHPEIVYPEHTPAQIQIIDVPNAPQIKIKMGKFYGLQNRLNNLYPVYQLSQIPFGGQFSSRLNMNLREDKGYTYGIRSKFSGSGIENTFQISSSVKASTLGESLDEIIKEAENIQESGLNSIELNNIIGQYYAQTSLQLSSIQKKHHLLNQIQKRRLSKKSFKKWYKKLSKFKTEQFNDYLKTLLDINNYSIVLVGDKTQILQELEWMDKPLTQKQALGIATNSTHKKGNLWPDTRKTKFIKGIEYPIYQSSDFIGAFKQAKKELGTSEKAKFIWKNNIYTTSVK